MHELSALLSFSNKQTPATRPFIDDWPIIDNRQSDTCDCLDRLCNFVTISNDLEYFNSGTLPKKGKFSDQFLFVFCEINRSDEF